MFAAQTIRQKIKYDWSLLENPAQITLRDSILEAIYQYRSQSEPLIKQLCLCLADIAMQLHEWEDPVRQLTKMFGENPEMVSPLLEFLAVLPEEFSSNNHMMDRDEALGRAQSILTSTANDVLSMLLYYHTHAADSVAIQKQILRCLYSWIRSGDMDISLLPSTPVIGFAFDALSNGLLVDVATDLICEITIRTSPNGNRSSEVIQALYSHLGPLRAKLEEEKDDPEAVRELCRIYTQAGEAWADLIAEDYTTFADLVGGLLQCAAYEEREIASITFLFWEMLRTALCLPINANHRVTYRPVFRQLLDIMIVHLRYPEELDDWTAAERDEFRDFRHVMGDVVKDCVQIIGAEEALARPYNLLCEMCTSGQFDASAQWQLIEAPLFSLRMMCREINKEETVLPKIMEMLPQLPNHPKIKYAAILVIGRYAEWTARHPELITYQLTFVSQGFDDKEAVAAAAQSLKFLCRECGPHLVDHLEQLHNFYFNTVKNMDRADVHEVTEGIAHVIAAVPLPQLAGALQKFCHPLAQRLHEIALMGKPKTEIAEVAAVKEIIKLLNQLGTLLKHSTPQVDTLNANTHPSIAVIAEIWPAIDQVVTLYAPFAPKVSEFYARLCSGSMAAYKHTLLPVLSPMMTKVVDLFNQTGQSCFLWASWRCVREYGSDDTEIGRVVFGLVETLTTSVFQLISTNVGQLDSIPDVIEDYFKLVAELLEQSPTLFCQSPLLPSFFACASACLPVQQPDALHAVIAFLKELIGGASPNDHAIAVPAVIVEPIRQVVATNASDFVQKLFDGLIYTFPRDAALFKDLAYIFRCSNFAAPDESQAAVRATLGKFPDSQLSERDKEAFLLRYASANNDFKDENKLASVLRDFAAAFRRRNLITERTH
ncbi:Nuclear import receptor [Thoreauomyces humboldtii]|nr:Nuclear import receptor [Thoreauomyces humboldtii]